MCVHPAGRHTEEQTAQGWGDPGDPCKPPQGARPGSPCRAQPSRRSRLTRAGGRGRRAGGHAAQWAALAKAASGRAESSSERALL